MFLNSYKYNSTAFNLFRISDKTDGFIPLAETMNVNAKISYHDPNEFSKEELKTIDAIYKKQLIYIDKIYELCKQNNCRLLFVTSPAFVDYDKDGIIKAPLRRHFAEKGYKLINFTNDSRFLKHRLFFKDQQHLNAKGAKIYTRAFADTLLSITNNEVLHDHLK